MDLDPDLALLLHERAIARCIYQWSHRIDRGDFEGVEQCYLADPPSDRGLPGPSVQEITQRLRQNERNHGAKQHFIGNMLIEVRGDRAVAESYYWAYFEEKAAEGRLVPNVLAGRWVDRLEQAGDEWRISRRISVVDWSRELPDAAPWHNVAVLTAGTRDEHDPATVAFRELAAGALT